MTTTTSKLLLTHLKRLSTARLETITNAELAERLEVSERTISRSLKDLVDHKLIRLKIVRNATGTRRIISL